MKNRERDDLVSIQFKADITDFLDLENNGDMWGFSISRDDRSAFVEIGTKHVFEKYIDRFEDSPMSLVIYSIQRSSDEIASILLDEIRGEEEGFVLNGELLTNRDFIDALGLLGENECERRVRINEEVSL